MQLIDQAETHRRVLEAAEAAAECDPCVMCAMVHHAWDENLHVLRDPAGLVVLERFARAPGHLLVVAAEHVERIDLMPEGTYLALHGLVHRSLCALQNVLAPKRVYVASLGSAVAAGKTFPHVHVHLMPVYEEGEDSRPASMFSWAKGSGTYEGGEAEGLIAKLRASLV